MDVAYIEKPYTINSGGIFCCTNIYAISVYHQFDAIHSWFVDLHAFINLSS